MSYSYSYNYYDGFSATSIIVSLVFYVLYVVAMWKLYTKAGEAGWKSIIPVYNLYIMFKISWGNGWLFLLNLIPIANIVIDIIMWVKLAKAYGKGGGFACGLVFLNTIFIFILGFGSAQYIGPDGVPANRA